MREPQIGERSVQCEGASDRGRKCVVLQVMFELSCLCQVARGGGGDAPHKSAATSPTTQEHYTMYTYGLGVPSNCHLDRKHHGYKDQSHTSKGGLMSSCLIFELQRHQPPGGRLY